MVDGSWDGTKSEISFGIFFSKEDESALTYLRHELSRVL